jgi:hypothetical protein
MKWGEGVRDPKPRASERKRILSERLLRPFHRRFPGRADHDMQDTEQARPRVRAPRRQPFIADDLVALSRVSAQPAIGFC